MGDPLTLGAYSEMQHPDASERSRELYAQTEDNVLFAGEGAIPGYIGAQCTHGALLSGVSSAVEIIAARYQANEANDEERPTTFPAAGLLKAEGPLGLDVQQVVKLLLLPVERDSTKAPHSFICQSLAKCAKLSKE